MKKLLNTLFVTSEDAYLTLDGENVVVNREKQVTARFCTRRRTAAAQKAAATC